MKERDYIELSYMVTDVKITIRFDKECLSRDFKAYTAIQTLTNKLALPIREYLKLRIIGAAYDYVEDGRKEGWFISL